MITAKEIYSECEFRGEGPFDGYHVGDFFAVLPSAEYATRSEAIESLRAAYKGDDSDGVGVVLPATEVA